MAHADDLAVEHVQRREQRRRAVAFVVVGHRPAAARASAAGPAACGPAPGSGSSRRTQSTSACSGGSRYRPTTSSSFSANCGSLQTLNVFDPMRLEAVCAARCGARVALAHADGLGHRARAPVRGALGRLLGRDAHDLFDVGGLRAPFAGAPGVWTCIRLSTPAARKRARQRAATRRSVSSVWAMFLSDMPSPPEYDACAHLNARFDTFALGKNPQTSIIVGTQRD